MDRFRTRFLYGVVFWTRFPHHLLSDPLYTLIQKRLDNVVVNLTLTGLGASRFEPRAPRTEKVLETLPALVALLGHPARVRWRFDPLLYGVSRVETFDRIGRRMAALSIDTCTFSFPAKRSLRGALAAQYRSAGIKPWPNRAAQRAFLQKLARCARTLSIRLLSCAQPANLTLDPWIEPAQCIPLEVLRDLHPAGLDYPAHKDRVQRRHCLCPHSADLGDYANHRCRTGCVYCYSPAGGPFATAKRPDWT